MTIINQKSISGITSVTFASAGDDLLTFHSNNGTERFRIDNSGNTKITAGIVTTLTVTGDVDIADKIVHTGDTDTAVRFPAADTVTVETGGAENARFTSSSITFKAPDGGSRYLFGEMGNSASAELSLYNSSDAQKVRIATNNSTFFNGGNVGIGTNIASPGRLTVNNVDSASTPTLDLRAPQNERIIRFKNNAGGDGSLFVDGTSSTIDYRFSTYSTSNALYIKNDGSIGVGTDSPTTQSGKTLHLHNGGGQQRLHLTTNNSGSQAGKGLDIILEHNTDGDAHILNHNTNGDLKLGAGDAERVRLLSSGGLTFNGDTAAANALDDYEEGTWTPAPVNFDGTITINSADYVKVGRLVHINMYISFSNTVDTSNVLIGGLPFTVAEQDNHYSLLTAHSNGNIPDLAMRAQGTTTQLTAVYLNNSDGDAKPNYNHVRGQFIICGGTYFST